MRSNKKRELRQCRRHERNSGWWSNLGNNYSGERFKKAMPVFRDTYLYIIDHIRRKKIFDNNRRVVKNLVEVNILVIEFVALNRFQECHCSNYTRNATGDLSLSQPPILVSVLPHILAVRNQRKFSIDTSHTIPY